MTDEELIKRAREMWQWKHGHRTYPSAEEVDALLRAADERDELRKHVSLAGGYHARTEREIEIRQATRRDPALGARFCRHGHR